MPASYIAIPFKSSSVNLLSNAYVEGIPSMIGVNGLMRRIEFLCEGVHSLIIDHWMVSYSSVLPADGKPMMTNYMKSQRPETEVASDRYVNRGEVEGVFYVYAASQDLSSGEMADIIIEKMKRCRFCGGTFYDMSATHVAESVDDLPNLILKLTKNKTHFFVEDCTDSLPKENRLEYLLEKIKRPRNRFYRDQNIRSIIEYLIKDEKIAKKPAKEVRAMALITELLNINNDENDITPNQIIQHYNGHELTSLKKSNLLKSIKCFKGISRNNIKDEALFIASLTDALEYVNRAQKILKGIDKDREYTGYYVPSHIGYVAIEALTYREGTRRFEEGDSLHAMAEPQIGLVRMRSHYAVVSVLREMNGDVNIGWSFENNQSYENYECYVIGKGLKSHA